MAVNKVFCTTREAAALLGVSLSTAQNWAESGLLESWKTEGGIGGYLASRYKSLLLIRSLTGCINPWIRLL